MCVRRQITTLVAAEDTEEIRAAMVARAVGITAAEAATAIKITAIDDLMTANNFDPPIQSQRTTLGENLGLLHCARGLSAQDA
jgi:hypothetical protein